MKKLSQIALAAYATFLAAPVMADGLQNTIKLNDRQYPYTILDVAPGMIAAVAEAELEGQRDLDLSPITASLQIKSPTGAGLAFEYPNQLVTETVGISDRLSGDPYEQITLDLSTPVMGSRVTGIHRILRLAATDAPDAKSLIAQLSQEYGAPSSITTEGMKTRITYAWGADGFIADLANEPEVEVEEKRGNTTRVRSFPVCSTRGSSAGYRFSNDREAFMVGCAARYTIEHDPDATGTTMHFSLIDYDLIRSYRNETDRQILELLKTSSEGGATSNLDL
jgi:hypothetical protein